MYAISINLSSCIASTRFQKVLYPLIRSREKEEGGRRLLFEIDLSYPHVYASLTPRTVRTRSSAVRKSCPDLRTCPLLFKKELDFRIRNYSFRAFSWLRERSHCWSWHSPVPPQLSHGPKATIHSVTGGSRQFVPRSHPTRSWQH